MPVTQRILLAIASATAGLLAWGAFSLVAAPRAAYGDVAMVTIVFTAAYVATVRGVQRLVVAKSGVRPALTEGDLNPDLDPVTESVFP